MAYQYKRRRPSLVRNFWVYRRLIGSAILLGLMLWFIWANDQQVTVAFPFKLGTISSSVGVVILLSALVGSLVTILIMTFMVAIRRLRRSPGSVESVGELNDRDDDRPPSDYAAKTTEGFSNAPWSN